MATKIYLPSSGAAAVSPAFYALGDTSQADYIEAKLAKGSTALANKTITIAASGSNIYYTVRMYVTPPITAVTFQAADTFQLTCRCKQSAANVNMSRCLMLLRIVSGDGATFRATLFSGGYNYNALATSLTSRATSPGSPTAFYSGGSAQDGDRLTIEIASRADAPADGTADFNFGEDAANALDISDSDTDADYPFLELSRDFSLYSTAIESVGGIGSAFAAGTAMIKGTIQSEV
jgi:hypothetical protein